MKISLADILRKKFVWIPAPILFLFVSVLAFGTQIPWLGFYLDDWIILNAYNLGGAERVFEYAYLGNRPLVSWIWTLGLKLLGTEPFLWQVWALFWRWITVVIIWLVWKELWPNAVRQVTLAALLFAVYPLFRQQATALTFSFHWICYFLYGCSLFLMIQAVRKPKQFTIFMIGALLTSGLQLFSQEFYTGVELLRPLVIWLALRADSSDEKERLRRTMLTWLPFLAVMIGYLAWRLFLMPTPGSDRNTPTLLYSLVSTPLDGFNTLLTMFLQDVVESLVGVWYSTFEPGLYGSSTLASLLTWGIVIFVSLFVWIYFSLGQNNRPEPSLTPSEPWYKTAAPFGFLALILGFAPGWSIGRHIYDLTGIYNDRFGMAGMFGAALMVVAALDFLLKKPSYSLVILSLLIGLGAGQNMRFETSYRRSWEKQLQLFWQLKWRAPSLAPQTTIIGDGAIISYMGSWATISALVQMYEPEKNVHYVDYWYLDAQKLGEDFAQDQGEEIVDSKNFMYYAGPKANSLVISFTPETLSCLWVLSEKDLTNRYITEPLKNVLMVSNLDRIQAVENLPLREDIFGSEVPRNWCYYFQKGDLARQFQDWSQVVSVWHESEQRGLHPRIGIEYAPFIEGFAHMQDWQTALALTKKAYFPDYEMRDYLCETWKTIADTTQKTPEKNAAIQAVIEDFHCQDELGEGR